MLGDAAQPLAEDAPVVLRQNLTESRQQRAQAAQPDAEAVHGIGSLRLAAMRGIAQAAHAGCEHELQPGANGRIRRDHRISGAPNLEDGIGCWYAPYRLSHFLCLRGLPPLYRFRTLARK